MVAGGEGNSFGLEFLGEIVDSYKTGVVIGVFVLSTWISKPND